MATIKEDIELQFRTTTDEEPETTSFSAGDEVEILETWDEYYLIRDDENHFYNIPKDKLEE